MNKTGALIAITSALSMGYNTIVFEDGKAAFVMGDGTVVADNIKTHEPSLQEFFQNTSYEIEDVAGLVESATSRGLPLVRGGALIPANGSLVDVSIEEVMNLLEPEQQPTGEDYVFTPSLPDCVSDLIEKLQEAGIAVKVVGGAEQNSRSVGDLVGDIASKFSTQQETKSENDIRLEQVREEVLHVVNRNTEIKKELNAEISRVNSESVDRLKEIYDIYGVTHSEVFQLLGAEVASKLKSLIS